MPKQTFFNLPDNKRQALVVIALEEFAEHDYLNASVSRIVARAEIAKGSIYQYFTDKQDLFLYLLDVAQQTLLGAIQQATPPTDSADFFTLLRWQMDTTIRVGIAYPLHARLIQRAYTAQLPFRDTLLENAQNLRSIYFKQLVQRGQAQGDIVSTIDVDVAVLVIEAVVAQLGPFLLKRLGYQETQSLIDVTLLDTPEVARLFDSVIVFLEYGLRSDKAESLPT